jgi:translation initiation factor IF-3
MLLRNDCEVDLYFMHVANVGKHDLDTKMRHIRSFLMKGLHVRVVLRVKKSVGETEVHISSLNA